jgi:YegS/Rv2252/BmrU family lipid kinase
MTKRDTRIFILNPVAGNGYALGLKPVIEEQLKKRGIPGEILLTRSVGHATELAHQAVSRGSRHIIGVGGDGTFAEIAQALVGKKGITFGTVAAGTGNDFIHVLGFSDRFTDTDWNAFFEGRSTPMDAAECNGRFFLNGMGLGFDAQVAAENYRTDPAKRGVKRGSKAKYWWHIIKTLVFFRETEMSIELDGVIKRSRNFMTTIANGRRFAGGFYLTPKAFTNDGKLDVLSIREIPFIARVKELLSVLKQTHLNDPVVSYHQVRRLRIEFPKTVHYHLDGEVYSDSKMDVRVHPKALNIIYNPKGKHFFHNPAKI